MSSQEKGVLTYTNSSLSKYLSTYTKPFSTIALQKSYMSSGIILKIFPNFHSKEKVSLSFNPLLIALKFFLSSNISFNWFLSIKYKI